MGSYKVVKATEQNPDWKKIDIEVGENSFRHDVSVNRVNKKGETFPEFDAIKEGATVEGELWESSAGKYYLFAPRVAAPGVPRGIGGGGGNRAAIRESQEFKAASIQRSQEVRDLGIKIAGAMRDATVVSLASLRDQPFPTDEEYKEEWRKWRDFFIGEFDQLRDYLDK